MSVHIREGVEAAIRNNLPHQIQFSEATALDALGLDELDRLSIAMDLDETFNIEITATDYDNWLVVRDIVATVCNHLGQAV